MEKGSFLSFLFETFFSVKQWRIWLFLAIVIAAYLINIKLAVALNDWNGRFYNALQVVDKEKVFSCLYDFILICSAIIAVLVTADYLQGRAALLARRVLTEMFFNQWLSDKSAFYRLRLEGKEPDNPDQRISEDVRDLIELFLNLCTSFLNSVLMIGSFSVILWNLSGPITIGGISIPGYMFWVCLIYTVLETLLTHLIGRKLKKLNFDSQKKEANLRASLLSKRLNAEAIAGLGGTGAERAQLTTTFSSLLLVLIDILRKKRNLEYFSVGVGQVTQLTPIFFSLPAFFAGAIELGGLMQIRGAFIDVARSLSWIAMSYQQLARFAATYERLSSLHSSISEVNRENDRGIRYIKQQKGLSGDFCLFLPNRRCMDSGLHVKLSVLPGEICILRGASGTGKSSILRVLAGFDYFAKGTVCRTDEVLWLTQKSYIFCGSLKANLAYPQLPETLADKEAEEMLAIVGLPELVNELEENDDWEHRLSGGEKQRIMLARALLKRPDILLLDEVTSALDEESAEQIVEVLREKLKGTAILMVTHQSILTTHADRVYNMRDFV